MRVGFIVLVLFLSHVGFSQNVEVIKFSDLQKKMINTEADLTVFNFWATWCGPCVKELPYFEGISDKRVDVVLVSMDFIQDLEKVQKFVTNKSLKSEMVLLNETDYGSFMPKVSKEWSGAIPATLFVNKSGKTYFHETEFSKQSLNDTIQEYLN